MVSKQQTQTLVLGIGNTLLSDEGVGVHVINCLQRESELDDDIFYMDGGTLSFTLAQPIESCDQLIVVDASEIKSRPGGIKVFENEEMDHFITTGNKKSVHEVGLVDVMSIAMLAGHLPARRALVGIQPELLDWGSEPTPAVQQAIPEACQQVRDLLRRWLA
jgi:hydrogenase maturation protease